MAEDEIERNTTLLYRAPEMCDLHMKRRVDEKVDDWALGTLYGILAVVVVGLAHYHFDKPQTTSYVATPSMGYTSFCV